jgi:pyrroline-5-carboxylate reductase
MKLGFFGAGNMVSAIAKGVSLEMPEVKMYFYTPSKKSAQLLSREVNGIFVDNLADMPRDLDWYFLGFKPQSLNDFEFNFHIHSKIVSILAGVTIDKLSSKFQQSQFVRVMPNTPSRLKAGMNLTYFQSEIAQSDRDNLNRIFNCIGETLQCAEESHIDSITPFTGCGPGILFEFANYLENNLKATIGDQYDTRKLIAQTFYGSSLLMKNETESFEILRDQVTSKKGVTFEILESMRRSKIDESINRAIAAGHQRIDQLNKGESL